MFLRVVNWPEVVAMVCDVAGGTAAVSLRMYSRKLENRGGGTEITGWDYHQLKAHGQPLGTLAPLVETERLARSLLSISAAGVEFFAYELDGGSQYEDEAKSLVREFADITVTVVGLTVGNVSIAWFLVSLSQNRDLIHWKMRYHERDQRPGLEPL